MNGVEKIEQKLADNFENAEIHDLCFIMLELGQPVINLRARINLEPRRVSLCRLQLKTRHAHRAFDPDHLRPR